MITNSLSYMRFAFIKIAISIWYTQGMKKFTTLKLNVITIYLKLQVCQEMLLLFLDKPFLSRTVLSFWMYENNC